MTALPERLIKGSGSTSHHCLQQGKSNGSEDDTANNAKYICQLISHNEISGQSINNSADEKKYHRNKEKGVKPTFLGVFFFTEALFKETSNPKEEKQ